MMNEKVSVITVYDQSNNKAYPWRIKWRGRVYTTREVGYHHTRESGSTLCHIFSVATSSLFFRLKFDTDNLSWTVEEVLDGEIN
jgi:hypothetical protein